MANAQLRRASEPPIEFEVGGDVTLYPSGSEEALLLNSTASEIWRRLAQPTSMDELVAGVAASFDRPVVEVAPHVAAVVEVLVERGVIVTRDVSLAG
jgi:hypothetical protein